MINIKPPKISREKRIEIKKAETALKFGKKYLTKDSVSKGKTMLEKPEAKTVVDTLIDKIKKQNAEEKTMLARIRERNADTAKLLMDEEQYARKYLTKKQNESEIIGARNFKPTINVEKVYHHYAKKYDIPFATSEGKRKMEDLVKAIHAHEVRNRDRIVSLGVLDELTKSLGLYL